MSVTDGYTIDPNSETWRSLNALFDERLTLHRTNLELPGLPTDDTENARGAIEELKYLKSLVQPQPVVATVEDIDNALGGAN